MAFPILPSVFIEKEFLKYFKIKLPSTVVGDKLDWTPLLLLHPCTLSLPF